MGIKKYDGVERRKALRVTYPPDNRPWIRVGENKFEIADISEWGLRFLTVRKIEFQNWIRGTVKLLCGESIDVEGSIVRETEVDVYMNINIPISINILYGEQRHINSSLD